MSTLTLTLPMHSSVQNGKQVTFKAPCDSAGVEGLFINNNYYELVDVNGKLLTDANQNAFKQGSMVCVVLDVDQRKAYAQGINSSSSINGIVVSQNSDFAEVYTWSDVNPKNEDRTGYFVSIDTSISDVAIVKAKANSEIIGVTMAAPAFAANANPEKFDGDNLKSEYSYVGFMGLIPVRTDNTINTTNVRCMPNDDGKATLSANDLGYQVVKIISYGWALIYVEPQVDTMQRMKEEMNSLQATLKSIQGVLKTEVGYAVQDTEPVTTKMWIDSSNGNLLKVYDGTEWIPISAAFA